MRARASATGIGTLLLTFLSLVFQMGLVGSNSASAEERIALLIGNQGYNEKVGQLKNPYNDAALIRASLEKLGFGVKVVYDTSYKELNIAMKEHIASVRSAGPGTISFFYYSGHGAADPDTHMNYAIPTDVDRADDPSLWNNSVEQQDILDKLSTQAPDAIHYVVFDACRNELQLASKDKKSPINSKGFEVVKQTSGILIAYATAPKRTASDAGDYARVLAEELLKPDTEAISMFRNVQLRVKTATGQDPWLTFPTLPAVYFAGQRANSAAASIEDQSRKEAPDMRNKLHQNLTVSDDGSKVRFGLGLGGETPVLFDVAADRLTDQPEAIEGLAAPDTESLKLSHWQDEEFPELNGNPLALKAYETSRSVAVAPGGDSLVMGAEWNLRAFDKDGKVLWQRRSPGIAYGVNIPRNGKLVVAAYGDGTIRWHRLSDGEEILALFVNTKSREWVLWTPEGYYTSSVAGDQHIGWQLNKGSDETAEFVTAARLKQHLYRPEIVKRAFELADPKRAVHEAGLTGFKVADLAGHAPPQFHIVGSHKQNHVDRSPVEIGLAIAGSNDRVSFDVKVNERRVTQPGDVAPGSPGAETTILLYVPLEKGENRVQIVARNAVGTNKQELLLYLDGEGGLNRKGKLFIVAIGVEKYVKLGAQNTLHYSGADARLIVDTLTKKAGPLHNEVKSRLLVSGGATPPTKANIEDALLLFRDAQPEDTVILFLAGHGVNEGADYLFLPEDAQRTPDGRWQPSTTVPWPDLHGAVQDALGRRIMFLDTVRSSGAYSSRPIKDAFDSDIIVFSATDRDTLAQERSDLGHGVFTYALKEGLEGAADIGKSGAIDIFELGSFVSKEVKRLTNEEQEPTIVLPGSKIFRPAKP